MSHCFAQASIVDCFAQASIVGALTNVCSPVYPKSSFFAWRKCSAMVWGSSVKHQPMRVGKEHVLNDEDVVQIIKK